jgi:hypothetical protein
MEFGAWRKGADDNDWVTGGNALFFRDLSGDRRSWREWLEK